MRINVKTTNILFVFFVSFVVIFVTALSFALASSHFLLITFVFSIFSICSFFLNLFYYFISCIVWDSWVFLYYKIGLKSKTKRQVTALTIDTESKNILIICYLMKDTQYSIYIVLIVIGQVNTMKYKSPAIKFTQLQQKHFSY